MMRRITFVFINLAIVLCLNAQHNPFSHRCHNQDAEFGMKAFELNGTDELINVFGFEVPNDSDWSMTAWSYRDGTIGGNPKNLFSNNYFPFGVNFGRFLGVMPGTDLQSTASSAPADVWLFTAITYNSSTGELKLYIDGTLNVTITQSTSVEINVYKIGASVTNTGRFVGWLADIALWTYEFSSSDVSMIYNGGNPRDERNPETGTDFSAYLFNYFGAWNCDGITAFDMGSSGDDGTLFYMDATNIVYEYPSNP